MDKPPQISPGLLRPAFGAAEERDQWIGAAFVAVAVALLAWAALTGGGLAQMQWRTTPSLLAVWVIALGVSHCLMRSPRNDEDVDQKDDPYRTLADSLGAAVARMRADGRVLEVHATGGTTFGVSGRDLSGQGYFDSVHVADRPNFLQALSEASRSRETKSIMIRLRRDGAANASGERDPPSFARVEVRLRSLGSRMYGDGGGDVISITRDISDVYELESSLQAAREEAQLAKTLKDRLLANVSHELRTPLNAILGFSEILGDKDLSPSDPNKRTEYARTIHSSADHLLSVVNLVLDMSKIEAGKFDIAPEPFSVWPLIRDCCDMLRLKAESGRVSLVQGPQFELLELVADKRACRQILLNLLSNAVKFTLPNGTVVVDAKREGDEIHFQVSDTGIGIDSDHLSGLGNPFYQVRSSYNRTFEGAGLGLSLVRGLVGLHGGSILLETECGVGTRVTARLPIDCRVAAAKSSGSTRLETIATLQQRNPEVLGSSACDEGDRKFA